MEVTKAFRIVTGSYTSEIARLPTVLPIFPLSGALLLPRGTMPLSIFEPRYLVMINHVLKTDDRMIGIIQPADTEGGSSSNHLCRVGCAGRLTNFQETEDGRYVIQLTGVIRFVVPKEAEMISGFRRVFADYGEFQQDLDPAPEIESISHTDILEATRAYFAANGYETDWEALEKTNIMTLVTSLSMACPFGMMEKQALLEANTPFDRATILNSLLLMGAVEHPGQDAQDYQSLN